MIDAQTKKRLGQYFSGKKVADLLVAICDPPPDATVIDPMAGDGDMLASVIRAGISEKSVYGIEVDKDAALKCTERVGGGHICHGDAFSYGTFASFGISSWDLVITNPPYVRYQSLNRYNGDGLKLKNAQEVRAGVRRIVSALNHLSTEEKTCFHNIINAYSGLSDLAVPSWLLCASLVKRGGMLAMVVPESWMSREYALSIKYMLRRFFDILYIVEDVNAAWFPEALVKTNLLIARRVGLRGDIQSQKPEMYRSIRLSGSLLGETSLVDGLRFAGETGERAFRKLLVNDAAGDGFESKSVPVAALISAMSTAPSFNRLMKKLEPSAIVSDKAAIPNEVWEAMQSEVAPFETTLLHDWGIQIGQGLRTGANKFFYFELISDGAEGIDVLGTDALFGSTTVAVAHKYALPALRYQNDVGDKYAVTVKMLHHRLLYIQDELYDGDGNLRDRRDESLASHLAISDDMTFESGGKLTRFRELSAVRPNIRETGRQWYMLPALAKRHVPQLCIPRVNNKNVRCMLVDDGVVVDANFSTLWTEPENSRVVCSALALMNSSWVRACLESTATVMGGGALKVEASHLRALPVPLPKERLVSSLQELGVRLSRSDISNSDDVLRQIDEVILRHGFGVAEPARRRDLLREFIATKTANRKR
jgi:tRNA1(Val) A37 N6-methylase TrmN6